MNLSYTAEVQLNPLSPNLNMPIVPTGLHTFLIIKVGRIRFKHQGNLSISFILMTCMLHHVLIVQGEIRGRSPLRLKGQSQDQS